MNTNLHFSSETDLWSTPLMLFYTLNKEFNFNLDVCATDENAKCDRYFTVKENGLKQKWSGRVWMNPPYGRDIPKWIKKAFDQRKNCEVIVCLIPARTDTQWWHAYIIQQEVRFIKGRLKFGGCKTSAPFPSALCIMRSN